MVKPPMTLMFERKQCQPFGFDKLNVSARLPDSRLAELVPRRPAPLGGKLATWEGVRPVDLGSSVNCQ
jgi:hypothetical protein